MVLVSSIHIFLKNGKEIDFYMIWYFYQALLTILTLDDSRIAKTLS